MKRIRFIHLATLTLALATALGGCGGPKQQKTVSNMPTMSPPVAYEEPAYRNQNPGSLFNAGDADYLFSDNRARRVGDIIIVNVVENSSASHEADTKADKQTTMDMGLGAFFGANPMGQTGEIARKNFFEAQTTSEFEGEGETTRKNSISATVAARVVRMLPGGVMQVEGAREIRVNDETQVVVVRGLVRQRDVGADNTISSTQLADAKIEFYGEGILAEKQKPGWLVRLLDSAWPF